MAESATVSSVKRFDIGSLFNYKRLQLVFGQKRHPQPLRLLEFAPGIRTDHSVYWGFGLEGVTGADTRRDLLKNALTYLGA